MTARYTDTDSLKSSLLISICAINKYLVDQQQDKYASSVKKAYGHNYSNKKYNAYK